MNRWKIIIMVILGFTLVSFLLASILGAFMGDKLLGSKDIAIIDIKGPIVVDEEASGLFSSSTTSSAYTVNLIKTLEKQGVKAVILDINSGGGSPVASDEIGRAIKESNMTFVAVIREVGASGAYWIATSADYIIANRMSITGSIGVRGSFLNFNGLMDDYNVTYERLVSGDLKDIGSPYKEMTEEEREIYQAVLDEIHDEFIKEVAENRNMSVSKVRGYATGMFFTGNQALKMNLIDEIGGFAEAENYIQNQTGISGKALRITKKKSFMENLMSSFSLPSFGVNQNKGFNVEV